jgi:hypothetical protein
VCDVNSLEYDLARRLETALNRLEKGSV